MENPAMCILDYLINYHPDRKKLLEKGIDVESFYETALSCEASVTPNTHGEKE